MAETLYRGDPLLDIAPWIGQMASSFRWSLVARQTYAVLGELHPMRDVTPKMTNDPSRTIKRQISNFVLPPDEASEIDLFQDRVRPELVLEDGRSFPLGVFMFLAPTQNISSRQIPLTTRLVDQGFQLDQGIRTSVSIPAGGKLTDTMFDVVADGGFASEQIALEDSAVTAGDPIAWPAGTTRTSIIDDLAVLLAWYSPYFNNKGIYVGRSVDELAYAPTLEYLPIESRVYADSIEETTTLLEAPNVYIVLNSGGAPQEIAGEYEVPEEAPHSVKNRGFSIVEVVRTQGIEDTSQAEAMARSLALQSPGDFRQVNLKSPPDPRHDTNDLVVWDGELWREVSWSMSMSPGGEMTHALRKVYGQGQEE
jgi:hypothetical protein